MSERFRTRRTLAQSIAIVSLITGSVVALSGCENNDVEDAADDAGDAVEDAVDDAGDVIDDATE